MKRLRYQTGGGVIFCADQVLLLDRPCRSEIRLPKGHVEKGEDFETAARRETWEESGYSDLHLVAELGSQRVDFAYQGRWIERTEHWFLYQLGSTQISDRPPEDERQFRPIWRTGDQAERLLTFESEQQVLRKAVSTWLNSARVVARAPHLKSSESRDHRR